MVLLALLVVPMVWTFGWALHADVPVVGNFVTCSPIPAALRSAWHSVLWVGIALVLIVVGYVHRGAEPAGRAGCGGSCCTC